VVAILRADGVVTHHRLDRYHIHGLGNSREDRHNFSNCKYVLSMEWEINDSAEHPPLSCSLLLVRGLRSNRIWDACRTWPPKQPDLGRMQDDGEARELGLKGYPSASRDIFRLAIQDPPIKTPCSRRVNTNKVSNVCLSTSSRTV
jgi:hypothetical protein